MNQGIDPKTTMRRGKTQGNIGWQAEYSAQQWRKVIRKVKAEECIASLVTAQGWGGERDCTSNNSNPGYGNLRTLPSRIALV